MQKEKLLLAEKELIELAMAYGYSGSELNNPHFLEKGYLKQNGTYDSFIKKVESICESWNRLKKKKGQPVMYEITNLYEKAKPIPDDRIKNGKKLTQEDLLMKDYIHFALGVNEINDGKAHSLNHWATLFGLTSNRELEEIKYTKIFKNMYWKSEIEKVVNTFKSTIINRNKAIVSNSFKQLEKHNKIKKNEVPFFIHLNGEISSPSQQEYDDVDFEIDKILASNNITRNDYYYNHYNKRVIRARAEVKNMLEEKGLKKLFIGYQIEVLESLQEEQWVGMNQFLKAYTDKLVQLTLQRENNPAYQVNYAEKRFYIFNTLLLLRAIGYEVEDALIVKYKPAESDIEAVHDSVIEFAREKDRLYKLQYAFSNRVWNEEIQAWGFVKNYLEEHSK
ncbi:hypothetical protein [Lysinibacillus xylanilyticus]|uniref:Uncharacterized protein n=1 Tax=Lysinibacillus xylanilyticus TaxID=582475 RepID=A0ABT4ELF4_9BACI|nr:hypothetical protein [Lysinibacillus xylanilyticus]MCY9545361.1 hypothetical protein [Lysinibacillus xylanilyticus]